MLCLKIYEGATSLLLSRFPFVMLAVKLTFIGSGLYVSKLLKVNTVGILTYENHVVLCG